MAQAKEAGVDLFGNPVVTPRQLLQQQLSKLLEDTAARTAGMDVRSQGASKMGAAAGALIGQGLIKAGVVEEPEEMKRARKFQAMREELHKSMADKGLTLENNTDDVYDLASSIAMRAGMEDVALKAQQAKQLHQANQRVAEKERAQTKLAEAQAGYYDRKGTAADNEGRSPYYSDVDLADGSKATLDHRTGQYLDPATRKPITDPKRLRAAKYDPRLQGDLSFAKESGQEGSKNLFAQRQLAQDAATSLLGIGETRKLLDAGMKTGKFANFETGLGAVLHELGISYKEGEVENAQAFVAAQAKQVASLVKSFGAGTGLSDADREFSIQAAGGDITMNEKSIRKILDINERAALNVIKNYKDLYGRVKKDYLPYGMDLPPDVPDAPKAAAPQKPDVESLLKKYGGK